MICQAVSQAIILAAGHGKRMQPLTQYTPKPLLEAGGKTLIEAHIERLSDAGISDIIINTGRLGHQFENKLGNGKRYGVNLRYAHEGDEPLETGGAIVNALPLFDDDFFIAVNGDIWTDYDFTKLTQQTKHHCHLVLVSNPEHNPQGDFAFNHGNISNTGQQRYTFSGIAVYGRALFDKTGHPVSRGSDLSPPNKERVVFSVAPLLRQAIDKQQASAELYTGNWFDIGTPQRLAELDQWLKNL